MEATIALPTANVASTTSIAVTATAIRKGTPTAANTPASAGTKVVSPTQPAATPVTPDVSGVWYSLSLGEAVALPERGLMIRFQAVTSDLRYSRNPTLYCRQAGEATVAFVVTDSSGSVVIQLAIPELIDEITQTTDYPKSRLNLTGCMVQLTSLKPYPGGQSDVTTLSPTSRPTPIPPLPPIATIFIAVAP